MFKGLPVCGMFVVEDNVQAQAMEALAEIAWSVCFTCFRRNRAITEGEALLPDGNTPNTWCALLV